MLVPILILAEVPAEPFPQLQPRSQQPRLHCRYAQTQRLRSFFRRKSFYVPQDKYRPKTRRQALDGARQNIPQLRLVVLLLRVWAPVRDFARQRVFLSLNFFVQRNHALGAKL